MTHSDPPPSDHQLFAHIGTKLRDLRVQARLSVAQAAERSGIATPLIERYEAGLGDIHAAHVYRLAVCYQVPTANVFAGLPQAQGKAVSSTDAQHLIQKFLTIDSPDRGERFGQLVEAIRQQQEE